MKKILIFIVSLVFVLGLSGCKKDDRVLTCTYTSTFASDGDQLITNVFTYNDDGMVSWFIDDGEQESGEFWNEKLAEKEQDVEDFLDEMVVWYTTSDWFEDTVCEYDN